MYKKITKSFHLYPYITVYIYQTVIKLFMFKIWKQKNLKLPKTEFFPFFKSYNILPSYWSIYLKFGNIIMCIFIRSSFQYYSNPPDGKYK